MGILLSISLTPPLPNFRRLSPRKLYALRVGSLAVACCLTIWLYRNFYYASDPRDACQWCRFLSCWPTESNNVRNMSLRFGRCHDYSLTGIVVLCSAVWGRSFPPII